MWHGDVYIQRIVHEPGAHISGDQVMIAEVLWQVTEWVQVMNSPQSGFTQPRATDRIIHHAATNSCLGLS